MYSYDKMFEVFSFFLVSLLVSLVPPLPWQIALAVLGVLALLLSIVTLLTGMLPMCGCELLRSISGVHVTTLLNIYWRVHLGSIT